MSLLSKHRVAIIAADGFEELELIEPLRALRTEGALVDVIAPQEEPIQGMHLYHKTVRIAVDRVLRETVLADQYDALVLPGGAINADTLRANSMVRRFVFTMNEDEKPIALVSHAAWILISAGIVANRKITAFPTLREDLVNAGALWSDDPVVVDGNLISARGTKELAEFDNTLIEHFSRRPAMISPDTRHMVSRLRFV